MTNQICLALLLVLPLGIAAQVGAAAEPVTVPLERETLVIPSGLEDWTLAWHASLVSLHNVEWVTGGESVENWTQLFTVSRVLVDPAMRADKFAALSLEGLRHGCPALRSAMYGESATDATYEWIVAGCPSAEDQDELVRIIRSGDYLFRIAYTRKGPDMDPRLRGHWLEVIRAIEPVPALGASLSSLMRWKGVRFQPGLPMAAAVRAQDGSHAAFARFFGNPIEGSDGRCTVTLELVSNDARTYVAYGSGFPEGETVSLAWKYGSNDGAHSVRTDSTGSFIAAVNHPGEAKGRGKWNAVLEASCSQCRVSIPYKWGEAGMKP